MKKTMLEKLKKKVLIFAVLLASVSLSFAATDDGISRKTLDAFHRQFSEAQNVEWKIRDGFSKVSFSLDSNSLVAYYESNGDFIAMARNILSDQLPMVQQLRLKQEYKNYWINELLEMRFSEETSYYAVVENSTTKLILESSGDGNWHVYSKEKKKHI